ncbi:pyridoxal phosphatase [Basfia succiniciproducens]|uniref:Cof protein n=1 Tax=Basfia succiniciproducens TaxID=653940 RepID=A0A1G5AA64_9PAST|nr:pyridoxal phosphatase [Basfia succiniciproducens]QIM68255.1 HAD family hydrolase [Basfia succiniciproducens]SCX74773.1 hypothetical protein SAMN02910354_00002 [Basfia succiniciproducens]
MAYQVLAFDLDGTLLNSQGIILPSSKKAIEAAREKGMQVILVTGRHHTAVKPYYYELNLETPIVCCNGTYLYQPQTDEVLRSNPFSKAQALQLIDIAERQKIHILMYSRNAMNYMELNPHMEKFQKWVQSCPQNVRPDVRQVSSFRDIVNNEDIIWKFVMSAPNRELMQQTVNMLPQDQFSCEWSWIDRVDISNKGNTKGSRLLEYLRSVNMNPEQVVAFGDNQNDLSMLTSVGLGVAMGNADEIVKQQAKCIIGTNNENSIADFIEGLK